jgi:hypothetical protein
LVCYGGSGYTSVGSNGGTFGTTLVATPFMPTPSILAFSIDFIGTGGGGGSSNSIGSPGLNGGGGGHSANGGFPGGGSTSALGGDGLVIVEW